MTDEQLVRDAVIISSAKMLRDYYRKRYCSLFIRRILKKSIRKWYYKAYPQTEEQIPEAIAGTANKKVTVCSSFDSALCRTG